MRALSPAVSVLVLGVVVAVAAVGCQTTSAVTGALPIARGEKFFQAKCNACHPGGGQGAGPPIDPALAPTFLERGKMSGRHGVPEAEWDSLLAFLAARLGPAEAVSGVEGAGGATSSTTTGMPGSSGSSGSPAVPPGFSAGVAAPAGPTLPSVPALPGSASTAGVVANTGVDPARGAKFFDARCNRCHPGGRRGVGPALTVAGLPGPLKRAATSGRHDVPADEYDHLLAHLAGKLGAVSGLPLGQMVTPSGGAVPAGQVAGPASATSTAASPAAGAGAAVDTVAGAAFFKAKCQKCHAGGNKITGKALPGSLVPGGTGKHGVPVGEFDGLLAYLLTLGAVRGPAMGNTMVAPGAGAAAALPAAGPLSGGQGNGTVAPVGGPGKAAIPATAGMVPCSCACQCPPGAPPAAIPAACVCQCTCPR
jgi:cytochrome c2